MKLRDIKTLQEVSQIYKLAPSTIQTRITLKSFKMIEGIDYRRLKKGQSVLFSPEGVIKIIK